MAKTPVAEIHLFDGDDFQVHNAFRAPGATDAADFEVEGGLKKVDYYYQLYSRMRHGIVPHSEYITKDNVGQLKNFNFAFISVDKNVVRRSIADDLMSFDLPFIDVGLGVKLRDDDLVGSIRVTAVTGKKHDHLADRIGSEEFAENEYATNIQISDLNCMNAVLAVMKWKKLNGFYQDLKDEHTNLFFINTNKLLNEDFPT
ncbi:MAG: hypothetical protein EOO01_35840 [Chitinophagaceae bacterium]|nr:MAG: hypothetical protein EOO01_35840 [Chitinophagaceae bacterium]